MFSAWNDPVGNSDTIEKMIGFARETVGILPDQVPGDYFRARKAQERIHLDEIERRLPPVPRVMVPQFESDVHGLASLERVGAALLAESGGRG